MTQVVVNSRVGDDGVLTLEVRLGAEEAGREVRVTVEPVRRTMTQAEWQAWVQKMAGCISDPGFERPPQGEYEVREPLS